MLIFIEKIIGNSRYYAIIFKLGTYAAGGHIEKSYN